MDAYVIEGHMDVTNPETGETKSLTDNQKLVVENGNIGEIQPMSQQEWDDLMEENGIEDIQPLSQEELEQLSQEDGQGTGSGINPVIYVVIGVVLLGAVLFGLRRLRKRAV